MDAQEKKYLEMTGRPVERLVCSFAIPSMVCMLVTSIYNLADTFFVGQIDTQSVAALGVVFPFMVLIQATAFFFGHGSGNYISRALGARNTDGAASMAATGLITAMSLTALLAAVCAIFRRPMMMFFGSTETILPYALEYFQYILLGTPFIAGCFVLNNQMRLQGNAAMSMIGILSGAILNIILDPIFIFGLNLGVGGAGMATAVSQFVGFCILLRLSSTHGGVGIHPKAFLLNRKSLTEIAAGGLPSLCRQAFMALATICLNRCAARFGDESVAAFSVVGRVMTFANALLIGFGQGFQPVCGFNYGAKLYDRVRRAFKFSVVAATVYCTVVAVAGLVTAPGIIRLFRATDPLVISIGTRAMRWQCLSFPLCGFVVLTNMYLQNIRKTLPAVIVALSRQGIFLIPAAFLLSRLFGLNGLETAQSVSDVCAFLLCLPLCRSALRSMK
ncbi:MAG: MATE family efflux transporter [Bacteroidales bacterium]|nr:MATE family efflux transporter [Bacteroidales bacterium]